MQASILDWEKLEKNRKTILREEKAKKEEKRKEESLREVRRMEEKGLREVMVKIGLEIIDIQEGIKVEVLLDSGTTGLVMNSKFARKQEFKLKKIKRPIYVRNVHSSFNKKRLIKYMVEVNIYYQ